MVLELGRGGIRLSGGVPVLVTGSVVGASVVVLGGGWSVVDGAADGALGGVVLGATLDGRGAGAVLTIGGATRGAGRPGTTRVNSGAVGAGWSDGPGMARITP